MGLRTIANTRGCSMFTFFTASDPTHGMVDYVSKSEATSSGLAFVQDDGTIVLGVDDTTQLKVGENRKSYVTSHFCFAHGPSRKLVQCTPHLEEGV